MIEPSPPTPDLLNRLDNMGKEMLAERTLRLAAEARATALAADVERLTRERDDERSNHRRTVEAMEFEQRDTEAALGREGEGE